MNLTPDDIKRLEGVCTTFYTSPSEEKRLEASKALSTLSIAPQNFEPFSQLLQSSYNVYLLQFAIQSLRRLLIRFSSHILPSAALNLGHLLCTLFRDHLQHLGRPTVSSLALLFGTLLRYFWLASTQIRYLVHEILELIQLSTLHCEAGCVLLSEIIDEISSHRTNTIAAAFTITSLTLSRAVSSSFGNTCTPNIAWHATYVLYTLASYCYQFNTSQMYKQTGHNMSSFPITQSQLTSSLDLSQLTPSNISPLLKSLCTLLLKCFRFDFASRAASVSDTSNTFIQESIILPTPSQWRPITKNNLLLLIIITLGLNNFRDMDLLSIIIDLVSSYLSLKSNIWVSPVDRIIALKYGATFSIIVLNMLSGESQTPQTSSSSLSLTNYNGIISLNSNTDHTTPPDVPPSPQYPFYLEHPVIFQSLSTLLNSIVSHFTLINLANAFHPLLPCVLHFDSGLEAIYTQLMSSLSELQNTQYLNSNISLLLSPQHPCSLFAQAVFNSWISRLYTFTIHIYSISTSNNNDDSPQHNTIDIPYSSSLELGDITLDELMTVYSQTLTLWSSLARDYSSLGLPDPSLVNHSSHSTVSFGLHDVTSSSSSSNICDTTNLLETSSSHVSNLPLDGISPAFLSRPTTLEHIKNRLTARRLATAGLHQTVFDASDDLTVDDFPSNKPRDLLSSIADNQKLLCPTLSLGALLPRIGTAYIDALLNTVGAIADDASFETLVLSRVPLLDLFFQQSTQITEQLTQLGAIVKAAPQAISTKVHQAYGDLRSIYLNLLLTLPQEAQIVTQHLMGTLQDQQRSFSQHATQQQQQDRPNSPPSPSLLSTYDTLLGQLYKDSAPQSLHLPYNTKDRLRSLFRVEAQMGVLLNLISSFLTPKNTFFTPRHGNDSHNAPLTSLHADLSTMVWELFRFYAIRYGHLSIFSRSNTFTSSVVQAVPLEGLLAFLMVSPAVTPDLQLVAPLSIIPPSSYFLSSLVIAISSFLDSMGYRHYLAKTPTHQSSTSHYSQSLMQQTYMNIASVLLCGISHIDTNLLVHGYDQALVQYNMTRQPSSGSSSDVNIALLDPTPYFNNTVEPQLGVLVDPTSPGIPSHPELINAAMFLAIHVLNTCSTRYNTHHFVLETALAFLYQLVSTLSTAVLLNVLPATRILTQHHHMINIARIAPITRIPQPAYPSLLLDTFTDSNAIIPFKAYAYSLSPSDQLSPVFDVSSLNQGANSLVGVYYDILARLTKKWPHVLTLPFNMYLASIQIILDNSSPQQLLADAQLRHMFSNTIIILSRAVTGAAMHISGDHTLQWISQYYYILVRAAQACCSTLFSTHSSIQSDTQLSAGFNALSLTNHDSTSDLSRSTDIMHQLDLMMLAEGISSSSSSTPSHQTPVVSVTIHKEIATPLIAIFDFLSTCATTKTANLRDLYEQSQLLVRSFFQATDAVYAESSMLPYNNPMYISVLVSLIHLTDKIVEHIIMYEPSNAITIDQLDTLPPFLRPLLSLIYRNIHAIPVYILVQYVDLTSQYLNLTHTLSRSLFPLLLVALTDASGSNPHSPSSPTPTALNTHSIDNDDEPYVPDADHRSSSSDYAPNQCSLLLHRLYTFLDTYHHLQVTHPLFYITQNTCNCLVSLLSFVPQTSPKMLTTKHDALYFLSLHDVTQYNQYLHQQQGLLKPVNNQSSCQNSPYITLPSNLSPAQAHLASLCSYLSTHAVDRLIPDPLLATYQSETQRLVNSPQSSGQGYISPTIVVVNKPGVSSSTPALQPVTDPNNPLYPVLPPTTDWIHSIDTVFLSNAMSKAHNRAPRPSSVSQHQQSALNLLSQLIVHSERAVPSLQSAFFDLMTIALFDGPEHLSPCLLKLLPYILYSYPTMYSNFISTLRRSVSPRLCMQSGQDADIVRQAVCDEAQIVYEHAVSTVTGVKNDKIYQVTSITPISGASVGGAAGSGHIATVDMAQIIESSFCSVLKRMTALLGAHANKPTLQ